jgi:retron-type reverse transcriptase
MDIWLLRWSQLFQSAPAIDGGRNIRKRRYREDILAHAYALVKSHQGAPGVDGQTFWGIETSGLEDWLSGIRNDLRAKTYQPQAVRRVKIPKPGGGEHHVRSLCAVTLGKIHFQGSSGESVGNWVAQRWG